MLSRSLPLTSASLARRVLHQTPSHKLDTFHEFPASVCCASPRPVVHSCRRAFSFRMPKDDEDDDDDDLDDSADLVDVLRKKKFKDGPHVSEGPGGINKGAYSNLFDENAAPWEKREKRKSPKYSRKQMRMASRIEELLIRIFQAPKKLKVMVPQFTLITVEAVEVSGDLRTAEVKWHTLYPLDKRKINILKTTLENLRGMIRNEVCVSLVTKFAPVITFKYAEVVDDSKAERTLDSISAIKEELSHMGPVEK